jgi:hypothetical protein
MLTSEPPRMDSPMSDPAAPASAEALPLLVNIGIHYLSTCAMAGPAIRGDLARALVVGERTGATLADWPPRLRIPVRRGAATLGEAVREGTAVAADLPA